MEIAVNENLKRLAELCPFPLYVVGGAVRDCLARLTRSAPDWDICAPVPPFEMLSPAREAGFAVSGEFADAAALKLTCGGQRYEFTSFRTDVYEGGGHSPSAIRMTDDIEEDARRRDFTCNAVYYDILRGQFVDPLGGMAAIEDKKLIPCAPADRLFAEDGARILRLARFCGELGFSADDETFAAARAQSGGVGRLSPARIWSEVSPCFSADEKYGVAGGCGRALAALMRSGALEIIFPQLFSRGGLAGKCADCASRAERGVRLAALLYHTGDECGALAPYPLRAARRREIVRLCSALRKRCGDRRAFLLSCGGAAEDVVRLALAVGEDGEGLKKELSAMRRDGVPMTLSELDVRGGDLTRAGVRPEMVGEALKFLLALCARDPSINRRDRLLDAIDTFYRLK